MNKESTMKRYTVSEVPLYIGAGLLELTEDQYGPRAKYLKPIKPEGRYEIIGPVCFKVGEEIGFDGNAAKRLKPRLTPVSKAPKNQK